MSNTETLHTTIDSLEEKLCAMMIERDGLMIERDAIKQTACALSIELAEARAEIVECDDLRGDMAVILRAVAIAVRGPEVDRISWGWADLPDRVTAAMSMMSGAVELAREHAAEIERLKVRLTDSGGDLHTLKYAPVEWVEWVGGCQQVPNGVLCATRLEDGDESTGLAENWVWEHDEFGANIVAYKVLP